MSGLFAVVVFSSGNLQSRRLGEIVKKEDLVDSEYLTTLLVLVARCDTLRFLKLWFLSTFIVYKLMFVCVFLFSPQGELPAVGEQLRVSVGPCRSKIQQVS